MYNVWRCRNVLYSTKMTNGLKCAVWSLNWRGEYCDDVDVLLIKIGPHRAQTQSMTSESHTEVGLNDDSYTTKPQAIIMKIYNWHLFIAKQYTKLTEATGAWEAAENRHIVTNSYREVDWGEKIKSEWTYNRIDVVLSLVFNYGLRVFFCFKNQDCPSERAPPLLMTMEWRRHWRNAFQEFRPTFRWIVKTPGILKES